MDDREFLFKLGRILNQRPMILVCMCYNLWVISKMDGKNYTAEVLGEAKRFLEGDQ